MLSMIPEELILESAWNNSPEIDSLQYDSRRVSSGALFIAVKGLITDGNLYIAQALESGAIAVATENPLPVDNKATWLRVADARRFLAEAANAFYNYPSSQIQLVGITGTNGKTTSAYLVHSILQQLGPSLMMGTLGAQIGPETIEYTMTTPESLEIQKSLSEAVHSKCRYGVMEVSSHSLFFQRVLGCKFEIAVFTNLSQDHLDFHENFEAYFESKALLFQRSFNPGLKAALINIDNSWGKRLAGIAEGEVFTFGFSSDADFHPIRYESSTEGTEIVLRFFGRNLKLVSPLVGRHNGYNIMAAAAACGLLEIPDSQIAAGISSLYCVPGRFEKIEINRPFTVINDFAHTPDALDNALSLARQIAEGRLLCVFGCGGDRDRKKRPLMGKIAVEKSDYSIITSDNPRSEDPDLIIQDIVRGIPPNFQNFETVTDRRQAIRRSLVLAQPGDLVLLAGKGHEAYQEIKGKKYRFDERQIVKEEACTL